MKQKCCAPGCKRERYLKMRTRYCSTHVHKHLRYGSARKRGQRSFLIGKSFIDHGYRRINWAGSVLYVHRLVDVITNGPLPKGWDVHHKDGNRLNNHWVNLQRIPKSVHAAMHARRAA